MAVRPVRRAASELPDGCGAVPITTAPTMGTRMSSVRIHSESCTILYLESQTMTITTNRPAVMVTP